jgi:hypothetical protein
MIPGSELARRKLFRISINMGQGKDGEKIYSDPEPALRQRDSPAWRKEVVSSSEKERYK